MTLTTLIRSQISRSRRDDQGEKNNSSGGAGKASNVQRHIRDDPSRIEEENNNNGEELVLDWQSCTVCAVSAHEVIVGMVDVAMPNDDQRRR